MSEIQVVIGLAALVLGPAGAAWVGVKVGLNGVREDVREVKNRLGKIEENQATQHARISVLEDRVR